MAITARRQQRDWESTFSTWSNPPGTTEATRCENAERAVKNAIAAWPALKNRSVSVFPQGSYCNRTNIPSESDVDVCVRSDDPFYSDLPAGLTQERAGIVDASYTFDEFKNQVEKALRSYFKSGVVTRGNKAFDIKDNTYRVSADAVPTFEYRRYFVRTDGTVGYYSGTKFFSDDRREVINWPKQNYDNGVAKNTATKQRYKGLVRTLKNLAVEMRDNGVTAAENIPSYLIDCLVYNLPNDGFLSDSHVARVRYALAYIYNETCSDDACREWVEVNELKYLFHYTQGWTREQVNAFAAAAWHYIGFN